MYPYELPDQDGQQFVDTDTTALHTGLKPPPVIFSVATSGGAVAGDTNN